MELGLVSGRTAQDETGKPYTLLGYRVSFEQNLAARVIHRLSTVAFMPHKNPSRSLAVHPQQVCSNPHAVYLFSYYVIIIAQVLPFVNHSF